MTWKFRSFVNRKCGTFNEMEKMLNWQGCGGGGGEAQRAKTYSLKIGKKLSRVKHRIKGGIKL